MNYDKIVNDLMWGNQYEKAYQLLLEGISKNPENSFLLILKVQCASNLKLFDEVISTVQKYKELENGDPLLDFELGLAYMELKNWKLALDYIKSACNSEINLPVHWEYLAICYYQIGSYKLAVDTVNSYLSREPMNPEILWTRAISHYSLLDMKSAFHDFNILNIGTQKGWLSSETGQYFQIPIWN